MRIRLKSLFASGVILATVAAPPCLANARPGELTLSGSYLAGRTASKLRDNDLASDYFTRALRADADNPVLIERVFLLELSEGKDRKSVV